MAKGITTRPRFREAGRRVCPHCGETAGRRNGTRKGRQMFLCYACRKTWIGEMPAPPVEQVCPYCGGYCTKQGKPWEPMAAYWREARAAERALLESGVGFVAGSVVERKRRRSYLCTACGRTNTGLWPLRRPYKYGEGCPYPVRILLDYRAQAALTAYCQAHQMSEAQAVRRIFGEAATRRIPGGIPKNPLWDFLEKDDGVSQLPRLPNGNPKRWNELREHRSFGEATVYLTYATTVNLDRKAYIGLLRTILHYGLTRQEAARRLVSKQ